MSGRLNDLSAESKPTSKNKHKNKKKMYRLGSSSIWLSDNINCDGDYAFFLDFCL